jgi:hypothetical protein
LIIVGAIIQMFYLLDQGEKEQLYQVQVLVVAKVVVVVVTAGDIIEYPHLLVQDIEGTPPSIELRTRIFPKPWPIVCHPCQPLVAVVTMECQEVLDLLHGGWRESTYHPMPEVNAGLVIAIRRRSQMKAAPSWGISIVCESLPNVEISSIFSSKWI